MSSKLRNAKKVFLFDPTKWLQTSRLSDGVNCCVIGQFLNKICRIPKKKIKNIHTSYKKFEEKVGKDSFPLFRTNDSASILDEVKLEEFKKFFEDTPYEFKVKGIDDVKTANQ